MKMPFAPLWHTRADGRGRSIDPAATVAFGPDIPRITGPSVAANLSIRRRDHGHAQAVIVFREAGVALVVVTADSGICRGDDHGAGIAVPPETRIARPVTTSNHRIGRRLYGNTVTTLLPVSKIAGPALAAKRGIGWNLCSQAGVFDPVPSEVAVPVVAPHISVCRHDKRDAAASRLSCLQTDMCGATTGTATSDGTGSKTPACEQRFQPMPRFAASAGPAILDTGRRVVTVLP